MSCESTEEVNTLGPGHPARGVASHDGAPGVPHESPDRLWTARRCLRVAGDDHAEVAPGKTADAEVAANFAFDVAGPYPPLVDANEPADIVARTDYIHIRKCNIPDLGVGCQSAK